MKGKFLAYLLAGVAGGITIAVLNFIPIVNYCCFLWGLLGGAIAAAVLWTTGRGKFEVGALQGLMAGVAAGAVAFVIYAIVGILFTILTGSLSFIQAFAIEKAGAIYSLFTGVVAGGITLIAVMMVYAVWMTVITVFSAVGGAATALLMDAMAGKK